MMIVRYLLIFATALIVLAGPTSAALRADWNPSSEPFGTSFGTDGVWASNSGVLIDQWDPNPTTAVIVKPAPPAGTNSVPTGSGLAIEIDSGDLLEMDSFGGTDVFNPAINTGDMTLVLLVAVDSLAGGRQVLFESSGIDGLSIVLINQQLVFTVSQRTGAVAAIQSVVDLTSVWEHASGFIRISACIDKFPASGDHAAFHLEASNGATSVSDSVTTNDTNFTRWSGLGGSGLGGANGVIGGDFNNAVTNLFGGGAFGSFAGMIGRFMVYDDALCTPQLAPTVTGSEKYWWSNVGWIDCGEQGSNPGGLIVGELFCSGWIWSSNAGWITVGDGSPVNGIRYGNTSGSDFGVNLVDGKLVGYGWASNLGWINFGVGYPAGPDADCPRVDLLTGETRGYAWSSNIGWIDLGESFPGAETTSIAFFDTDGDGISDAWERYRLVMSDMPDDLSILGGPGADFDGDGSTDLDEFNADTNPFDRTERLLILNLFVDVPLAGQSTIEWSSKPSRVYQVYLGDDLNSLTKEGAEELGSSTGSNSSPTLFYPSDEDRDFIEVRAYRPLSP